MGQSDPRKHNSVSMLRSTKRLICEEHSTYESQRMINDESQWYVSHPETCKPQNSCLLM